MKLRSIQVASYDKPNESKYSDLQVMKSGAGWYIGTIYTGDEGYPEPGSRDTPYFPTKDIADAAFELMPRFVMSNGVLDAGAWCSYATFVLKINCTYRFNP